ncbi:hypothetical protein [Leptospira santarosai]|uniref:hypothetical protein n=1 Tax=Leptospira santarosai TaxID=28183 RepID=UPI0006ACDC22|nr:hypothetical protein [Leptospira santarosai]
MLVICLPDTFKSLWVPFEIGYTYEKMGNQLKLLKHKEINKNTTPGYLKVRDMIYGTESLNRFLSMVRKKMALLEEKNFNSFPSHKMSPFNKYLGNQ